MVKPISFLTAAWVVSLQLNVFGAEPIRAVQLDLARQKESVPFVKAYMNRVRAVGYNTIVLYLEDRVKTPSYPYSTDAESYSVDEAREIAAEGVKIGLDVVPVVSPLGHTERFLRHPALAKFAETREGQGRFGPRTEHYDFCLMDPEAREWMARYIGEVAAIFPSKNFHFGFDETFDLGFCSRCRPVLEKEGLAKLYLKSVLWAHDLATKLGKRMWMWDDFFDFFPEDVVAVPRDVLMCTWNYDPKIEKTGPRAHFGGRLRRDLLKDYECLGFDALACPWFEYENIRSFTEYAQTRRTAGSFLTQWEMETDFHGTFLPRVLGTGLLWSGKAALANGEWLDAGIRAAYPTATEEMCRAIRVLVLDEMKFKFDTPSVGRALNATHKTAQIAAWRTAVEILRRAPSRPGEGEIPADPLSEAALLDDLVIRSELSAICEECQDAARYLHDPARVAAESQAWKRVLAADLARAKELLARREKQWHAWRSADLSAGTKKLHGKIVSFMEDELKVPDAAPASEWLLEVDVAMTDTHGAPQWTVEGRFGDTWKNVWSGGLKTAGDAYSPKLLPVTFEKGAPTELRVSHHGYGAGTICHVSLRNRTTHLVPEAILAVSGRVNDPGHLLVDDYRETRFGDPDCVAAVLDPRLADAVSSVTMRLVPEGRR